MNLKPLKIKTKLSLSPKSQPLYPLTIKNLKGESVQVPDPRATRSMLALMNLGAVNGGAACHWGGPSAMMETWTALHSLMFKKSDWFESYHFVNDIGHAENGIYALRTAFQFSDLTVDSLKGFRSIKSKLTGHGESHLYPEGVLLSNGPLSSAFAQSQGLAMADKIIGNDRVTVVSLSDGAAMEGEAKEALSAIPGLAKKGKLNPFVLLLSDNNTKLGGRIDKDSYSMNPSFSSLETLGWKVIKIDHGHDLQLMYQSLEKVFSNLDPDQPVCVWIKTIKGYGVKSTEDSSSGGHGFPLKAYDPSIKEFLQEIWGKETVPSLFLSWADELLQKPEKHSSGEKKDKIQVGVAKALIDCSKKGYPLFSLSSDLQGSTGVKGFQSEFKDRFIDLGIAESNMVSAAAGMSKLGFIPVVDTFAAFGVTKGSLPLIMSSLSESPLIAFFSHTGFQDAADGASHQSLTYISSLASIPHVKLVNLSCADEAYALVSAAVEEIAEKRESGKVADSYIFFLGRENFPLKYGDFQDFKLGEAQLHHQGKDLLIVASGSTLEEALKAKELLKDKNIDAGIVHHPFVNSIYPSQFKPWIESHSSKVITVEDHQVLGGMGAILTHELKQSGLEFKLKSLGVKNVFGQSAYSALELYEKHGLDSKSIVKAALDF